jgi:hypothetical protein
MQPISDQISLNTRLASIVIDQALMIFLCSLAVAPGMFLVDDLSPFLSEPYDYLALLGPTVYLCKDIVGGRSLGKCKLNLQVVNEQDGQAASPVRCVIRNVTLLIWPVELLIAMLNPSRRLGDRLANTRLCRFNNEPLRVNIRIGRAISVLVVVYGLVLIIALLLKGR